MDVQRLPIGQNPPDGADFIEISKFPQGYMMTGIVGLRNSTMSVLGPFQSYDTAEKLGIIWGEKEGAKLLHVVRFDA